MVLVQREEQFARLRTAFLHCGQQQRGHVTLVTGAVGSGKTSLLEAFRAYVTGDGGQVLSAIGSRVERNLPFGLIAQLFDSARLASEPLARIESLTRDPAFAVPLPEPGDETPEHLRASEHARAKVLHGLFTALLELTDDGPLVLAIDDVHHADVASLHALLYLVRRLRYTQIMVVLTESSMLRPPHPVFRAELLSQPYFSRIALPPLTKAAIVELAGGDLDPAAAEQVSERCLSVTGGSPLLARAYLDERMSGADDSDQWEAPHSGDTFGQAVLGCLYRHEPGVRRIAQALAVLDRPARPELLGQVLEVPPEYVVQAVRVLRTSGLVHADQLRHARILRSVLGDLPADDRCGLHRRAAQVLHEQGAEPSVIAEHLVASDWAEDPWVVRVLHEAAERALAMGRPDVAGSCLRLVGRADLDGEERTATNAMLVSARWQVNPLAADPHLDELLETARSDGWSAREAQSIVPYLLWQGRVEEATEALTGAAADDASGAATAGHRMLQLLVSLSHPEQLRGIRDAASQTGRPGATPAVGNPALQAMTVLAAALMPSADHDGVAAAEPVIQRHNTDDGAIGLLTAPLIALLYAGRPDRVAVWIDLLLDRPSVRHSPIWQAVLRAIRAEAAIRLGDLAAAQQHAHAALKEIPAQAWGVAIAGPLATLITCATESGRYAEADRWLSQPIPAGMFRTPLGLHYLAARGRHHLAADRSHAAANDLRRCGELMREWGIDVAGLVPWRLELARVQLSLGNKAQAAALLQEQLRCPHGVDDRTRGRTLRLLAATAGPDQRRALLSEAVNLLQSCGDRVELARALGDTGQVLQRVGHSARARLLSRRAYQLAQDSGATVLAQRLLRREPSAGVSPTTEAQANEPDDGLSEAERRVAALAALGHTNRQISSKLYITVSTVEQHLTRVYRKLQVKRRSDLPTRLIAYAEAMPEETRAERVEAS